MLRLATWIALACLITLAGCRRPPPAEHPARIVMFRHAEKPDDPADPHLSPAGEKRAQKLSGWLAKNFRAATNWNELVLFAAQPTRHGHSLRCVETLTPFSEQIGQPIQTPCLAADFPALADRLQTDPALRGKTVVICWVHDYLPEFAAALGVRPPPEKWKGDDFDSVYLIRYPQGAPMLEKLHQRIKTK